MTGDDGCSLAVLLSAGGPVKVSVRPCCLVALVGRRGRPDAPVPCEAALGDAGGGEVGGEVVESRAAS